MPKSSSTSTKDKKEDKKEPSGPKKTESAAPKRMKPVRKITGQVFKTEKDVPRVFSGTFEECEFQMSELTERNFATAKFVKCKFGKDFKFVNCNLGRATGVDKVTMVNCLKPMALVKMKERKTTPRKEKR